MTWYRKETFPLFPFLLGLIWGWCQFYTDTLISNLFSFLPSNFPFSAYFNQPWITSIQINTFCTLRTPFSSFLFSSPSWLSVRMISPVNHLDTNTLNKVSFSFHPFLLLFPFLLSFPFLLLLQRMVKNDLQIIAFPFPHCLKQGSHVLLHSFFFFIIPFLSSIPLQFHPFPFFLLLSPLAEDVAKPNPLDTDKLFTFLFPIV